MLVFDFVAGVQQVGCVVQVLVQQRKLLQVYFHSFGEVDVLLLLVVLVVAAKDLSRVVADKLDAFNLVDGLLQLLEVARKQRLR